MGPLKQWLLTLFRHLFLIRTLQLSYIHFKYLVQLLHTLVELKGIWAKNVFIVKWFFLYLYCKLITIYFILLFNFTVCLLKVLLYLLKEIVLRHPVLLMRSVIHENLVHIHVIVWKDIHQTGHFVKVNQLKASLHNFNERLICWSALCILQIKLTS